MSRRQFFATLCGTVFLVSLARVIFAPLVQPAAADFGVSAAELGIVASAAWLGSATPRLPTGYLLTRVPRHYVIVGTGTLLVVTATFTGLATSITHLTVGAFLMGASSGIYFIAANPLVSELYPETVGKVMGIHGMAAQIGAVVAPLVLGAILLVGNWRMTFFLIATIAAVTTIALLWGVGRVEMPEAGVEDRSLLAAGRAQWRLVLTGIVIVGTAGFLWNAFFNLFGDYLAVTKGIPADTGRLLLSGMFAAGVPAFLLSGRLADRVPNVPLLLSIGALFALGVLAMTVVEGLLAVAIVALFVGFIIHSLFPAVDTYLLSGLPDHHRGSAYALFSSAMMGTQAFGAGTVGTLVTRGYTYTAIFQGLALALAGIVACLFVLYRCGRLPGGGTPGTTPAVSEAAD